MKAYLNCRELKIILNANETAKLEVIALIENAGLKKTISGRTRSGASVKLIFPAETKNAHLDFEEYGHKANGESARYEVKLSLSGWEHYKRYNFVNDSGNNIAIGIFNRDALSLDEKAFR